ncbi:DUF1801 domain-containing protein [Tsuneonella sp. HG222]
MAENKTKANEASVAGFIAAIDHPGKREDAAVLDVLFRRVTGEEARMWGPTIIGYGRYRYRYDSGREGEMCRVGFSPRKARHSLYVSCNCKGEEDPRFTAMVERLGKTARGNGGCLYVNKLADIDLAVLEEMIALSWANSLESYPD